MGGPRIAAGGTLILDGSAVAELAAGGARVRAHLEIARERRARVVISAVTLAESLRGDAVGAALDEVLARITVLPVTSEIARLAGKRSARGPGDQAERSGVDVDARTESTVDAIVAATALRCARPVVLLTAVPEVMRRLLAELAVLGEVEPSGMSETAKVQAGEEIFMDERGGGAVRRAGRPRVAIAQA
ncbi:putative nucleic acid-binding protein [Saccharopolyspora gloriosae]|uniref:Putative nucleic acid-binding protein n=1 Tax=Saccharopolyspora gloriosae TaxID=455344 RepID=A0A840NAR6_9PSEU|nr:hypothetical protein [Saccharopolyspora gloriosae]MBB5067308.1 putative nucleic acid-binding protein [Saccharopolyspora gloriosae]